jgi:predicted O-methyltransferase YrrM
MKFKDFVMPAREQRILTALVRKVRAKRIAEFGCGGSTALFAQAMDGTVLSWDNLPEWIDIVHSNIKDESWASRIDIRLYSVTPEGDRSTPKDSPPYDGPEFDMVFIDGPRSAHATSFGRHGSFRFAVEHTREGGIIAWHDNDRLHEQEMVLQHLDSFTIHNWGRIGWCWKKPSAPLHRLIARVEDVLRR